MTDEEDSKSPAKDRALSNSGHASTNASARNALNRFDRLLGLCLVFTGLLLVLGWTLPVMTVETFFIFEDRVTIAGALQTLLEEGEVALFVIVLLFTVIFPVAKLSLAYWASVQDPDHASAAVFSE